MRVSPAPASVQSPALPALPPLEDAAGMHRRDFVRVCLTAAAAIGLSGSAAAAIAEAVTRGVKPSVIWLHFQECTGCTESLLRTSHPDVGSLILDLISLDYHETLLAAAGHQADAALEKAMADNKGKYVCIIEGAIPTKENGIYCMIGGRTAIDIVNEVAADAGGIIAIGSCASWGGVPSADPNPTGATGAPMVLKGKTVVTIPGCPANPYNLLGTVLQYATLKTLPELDDKGRPKWAYGRTIHEHCPRRAHFDAGRFAQQFGDEGHREGYCLYKLGCKGPATHANCSVQRFNDAGVWPVSVGHPCIGCTEPDLLFKTAIADKVQIHEPTPFDAYAPISVKQMGKGPDPLTTGLAGLGLGAAIGAGAMLAKRLPDAGPETENQAERRHEEPD